MTPFEEITAEQYDEIMNINVREPFFVCQKTLPHLVKSDFATIINIASVTAHRSIYGHDKNFPTGSHE